MDNHQDDDQGDISIKPVSSLRAQFEQISTRKVTPPPKATKPSHLHHVGSERGRSSLDMPSRTSTWTANDELPRPDHVKHYTKAISRTVPAPPKSRPTSMGPWSSEISSPIVTIHPPQSPQRSVDTSTVKRDVSDRKEIRAPELPFRNIEQSLQTPRHHTKPPGALDLSNLSHVSPPVVSPGGLKKAPPPINRASKPMTPSISTFGSGLGAIDNRSQERISPFSTPPESDDSPVKEEGSAPSKINTSEHNQVDSYFPLPPMSRTRDARRDSETDRRERIVVRNTNRNSSPTHRSENTAKPSTNHTPLPPTRTNTFNATHNATPAQAPAQPPRPIAASGALQPKQQESRTSRQRNVDILPPPPKRNLIPSASHTPRESPSHTPPSMSRSSSLAPALPARNMASDSKDSPLEVSNVDLLVVNTSTFEAPDNAESNRRPPRTKCGTNRIWTQYDTRSLDLCGDYVCTGGHMFRAWDINTSRAITDYAPETKDLRITAFVFKPGRKPEHEGLYAWLGNSVGEMQEIDLKRKVIVEARPDAHGRRQIIKMLRFQNFIWSLDDEGKLLIWPPGDDGVPSLRKSPRMTRTVRSPTCSIIVKGYLWIASGRNIHVYDPMAAEEHFNVTLQPMSQPSAAEITSAAVISSQLDTVYFGHSDGKISIYSTTNFTCRGIVAASPYKINCLVGAGVYLWAGFNTGMIHVYDTQSKPWKVKKEWNAHQKNPVLGMVVDLTSVWKFGHLQVASLGADNAVLFWDGLLEDDWIGDDMRQHDVEFCTYRELTSAVMTWNAGASTPGSLARDHGITDVFREAIRLESTPDVLVFGFQELIDLEDKKLTAKSIFKGSKKKDSSENDHMSYQYRVWRDYLTQLVETFTPGPDGYTLIHTASMVGLFTCVFVKSNLRNRIQNLKVAEIKRGLGGLHGNKGAIIVRFIIEDTSVCFTNCHLAAGQSQTASRNSDITAILEAAALPEEKNYEIGMLTYVGGGDGSMITDHEICIINGDLNYRIDTMSRDTVIKAINSSNLAKLLERDQLLVSKRRNPGFRLRLFKEQAITFAPTYKYDVGTDRFDTSEKARSPAWCDRILYRGIGCVRQVDYKRHELKLSDHRPVSALFLMRIKKIDQERRAIVRDQAEDRLADVREELARAVKLDYLVNVLGTQEKQARIMLDQQNNPP